MSLKTNDLFIVERGGTHFKMSASEIADFVGAVRDHTVADISERDALTNLSVGDRVFVTDASADNTVNSGWAIYRSQSIAPKSFQKIQENEGMDVNVVASVNLSAQQESDGRITIQNSAGNNANIPIASSTKSGILTKEMFANLHEKASSDLSSQTNPIKISDAQKVSFSISQLSSLP